MPTLPFLEVWGVELVLFTIYLIGTISIIIQANKKENFIFPIGGALLMAVAGWLLNNKEFHISPALFAMALLLAAFAIYLFIRRSRKTPHAQ